ncbi:hypothetical protein AB3R30_12975 [Leptolyngbyaceae cyanobacterium UHCC 1019]
MLFRLILLLVIAGVMTLFTLQNLTPVLPLVFLGSPTLALPLSWWILGAIAAGALTTLAITFLVGLSNFLTGQGVRAKVRSSTRRNSGSESFVKTPAEKNRTAATAAAREAKPAEAEGDAVWQDWRGYESSSASESKRTNPQSAQDTDLDDWEQGMSDDWEEPPRDRATPSSATPPPARDRFEQPQQPKQGSRSGSAYSYSYREPEPADSGKSSSNKSSSGKSDSGKPEQVVDADFRVLVPPYRSLEDEPAPPLSQASNADSWFEDEEEGDERRSQR